MILQPESGLTSSNYTTLRAATGDPSATITLLQYSLALSLHDSDGLGAASDYFDALVCGAVLVRAYRSAADTLTIGTLASEDAGDQSWSNQNLVATSISATVPPSLVASGNTVRVFWWDGTDIKYFESTDNGTNWGAAQTVATVSGVQFLGATALTRCHYVTLTTKNNRRFHVATYNGSWSTTDSGVYWPFVIDSFDAIAGNQVDDGAAATNDILVFATYFSPIIGTRIDNTKLIHTVNRVQGLAAIRYQNGRWSDHYEIDVVDRAPAWPSRYDVRVSDYGAWLFLCYYRKDGTEDYSHTSIALSRSKDGIRWELPYLLTASIDGPSVLLKRGNHAYVLNAWKTYRSASVGYTGDSKVTQELQANVTTLSLSMGDIRKLDTTVGNPEGELDATSPFSTDACLEVKLEMGYSVSGTDLEVQTYLGDIDSIGKDQSIPRQHATLLARDHLSRLMAVRADQANEWSSQVVAGDNFQSVDDTDYSGLRNTAVQDGSWKAPAGEDILRLISSTKAGIAFNTACPHCWNGSAQAGFKVEATDQDDFAGLLFRAYDKYNFLSAQYDADADTICLYDRREGIDFGITDETAAKSWSVDTWYYLMVRFRYGYAWVYSSTDGVTWTEDIATELPGFASTSDWTWVYYADRSIPLASGRMGYVASGYATSDDNVYPDPPQPPNPGPGPPDDPPAADQWIFGTNGAGVYYSNNIEAASPNYHDWSTGLDSVGNKTIRQLKKAYWPSTGRRSLFAVTTCGIYERDIPASSSSDPWVARINTGTIAGMLGICANKLYINDVRGSIEKEGWWWGHFSQTCTNTTAYYGVIHTRDGWETLHSATILWGRDAFDAVDVSEGQVAIAQHSNGLTVYCAGAMHGNWDFVQHDRSSLWKSTDGGLTFNEISYVLSWYEEHSAVHIPYHSADWDDSVVYWLRRIAAVDDNSKSYVLRSADSGVTFAVISQSPSAWDDAHTAHISGPSYDKEICNARWYQGMHEYTHGTWTENWGQFQAGNSPICYASWVMERRPNMQIKKLLWGGYASGGSPANCKISISVYQSGGSPTETCKLGDWATVTSGANLTAIAGRTYEAL